MGQIDCDDYYSNNNNNKNEWNLNHFNCKIAPHFLWFKTMSPQIWRKPLSIINMMLTKNVIFQFFCQYDGRDNDDGGNKR